MTSWRLGALALAGALAFAAPAPAQDYPARAVRIVVPFAPGGTTDVVARIVAQRLSAGLGQQFVVDNRGGAGGTLGADLVAKAPPDGYTLLLYHIGMVFGPALYKSLPYDVVRDFTPVGITGVVPSVVVVGPSMTVKTLRELTELARAKPGELNYGSAGAGSSDHLTVELFQRVANVKVTHVPYKGGGPAVAALIAGEVQFMIETAGTVVGQIKSGQLRPLAITSETRSPAFPDVPTMIEAGLPDYAYTTWDGLWAPAKTPPAVIARLNAALQTAFAQPETKALLEKAGVDPVTSTPEQFAKTIETDLAKWTKIIEDAGITVQ